MNNNDFKYCRSCARKGIIEPAGYVLCSSSIGGYYLCRYHAERIGMQLFVEPLRPLVQNEHTTILPIPKD